MPPLYVPPVLGHRTFDGQAAAAPQRSRMPSQVELPWPESLCAQIFEGMREEWTAKGRAREFEALAESLARDPHRGYRLAAFALGISDRSACARASVLRRRYRCLLHQALSRELGFVVEADGERSRRKRRRGVSAGSRTPSGRRTSDGQSATRPDRGKRSRRRRVWPNGAPQSPTEANATSPGDDDPFHAVHVWRARVAREIGCVWGQ
jgi:hypothetical protein